jgi:hypothetical protein
MNIQAPKTNTTGIQTARTISKVSSFFLFVVSSCILTGENSPRTCNKNEFIILVHMRVAPIFMNIATA